MEKNTKIQIGAALLEEIDKVFRERFHIPLEQMITELRIRNMFDCISPDDTYSILSGIRRSGVLFFSNDNSIVRLRKAIDRYVDGSYGYCIHCKDSIPEEWLLKTPLLEYCYDCTIRTYKIRITPQKAVIRH